MFKQIGFLEVSEHFTATWLTWLPCVFFSLSGNVWVAEVQIIL